MTKTICFYCSSASWGGLEMNMIQRAGWFSEKGWNVFFAGLEGTRLEKEVKDLEWIPVSRNPKYFAIRKGRKLAGILARNGIKFVVISDNRDMSVAVWARYFSKDLKVVYLQAMKLGLAKRDLIHTIRFNHLDAWVASLPYLEEQAKRLTRIKPEKLFTVRLGIDRFAQLPNPKVARESMGLEADRKVVGVLGRIDRQKGQLDVVRAFIELAPVIPETVLVLMGDKTQGEADDYLKEIELTIQDSAVADRVVFKGFDPRIELFFGAIDLFILPSQSETYGMVTVEAMVCGKHIIATNTGGTPELLDDGRWGLLYNPGDVQRLTTLMKSELNSIKPGEIKSELREFALGRYSHETECLQLEKIMETL